MFTHSRWIGVALLASLFPWAWAGCDTAVNSPPISSFIPAMTAAADDQERPVVASDGKGYLVVWQDRRSGNRDIHGTRVDAQGKVLDTHGFVIAKHPSVQARPRLAFDGTQYLVTWEDSRNGNFDIYAARISTAGKVLDPQGFAVVKHQIGRASCRERV